MCEISGMYEMRERMSRCERWCSDGRAAFVNLLLSPLSLYATAMEGTRLCALDLISLVSRGKKLER